MPAARRVLISEIEVIVDDGEEPFIASAFSKGSEVDWQRRPTEHQAVLAVARACALFGHQITGAARERVRWAGEQAVLERTRLARLSA